MPRIAIVGAGFGGLGLGISLKRQGIDTFTIFEAADAVGGVWRANTYPGAECDIPSALYSYSFENFDWPNKWSHQPVIKAYLEHCVTRYHLESHIELNTPVTEAIFDEEAGAWEVTVDGPDGWRTERFDIVVSATGQLSRPRWPDIEGMESFEGAMFHSAEWDHSIDLTDKRVATIGCGASAIQYVPPVSDVAAETTIFQRSPNWIVPKNDRDYSKLELALIRRSRFARNIRRFGLFFKSDIIGFNLMRRDSRLRPYAEAYSRKYLREQVSDPAKVELLTPDYPLGAKRALFSDDFYQAIEKNDVAIVGDPVVRITPTGVVTRDADGTETDHELDVIVIGTGFTTQDFLTPMKVVGRDGRNMNDEWSADGGGPQAHLGISVAGYPNLFFMYGPNTNLGHTSIVLMLESQARYLLSLITQMAAKSIQAVEVRQEVQDAYNAELDRRLADLAWGAVPDSWYLQAGRVVNNWVGRTTEYRRRTNHADLADFHLTPR